MNPKASDGKIITCKDCGSYRYLVKDCQHSYERKKDEANLTDTYPADENNMSQECCHFTSDVEENDFEIERFILFTSDDKEMSKFTSEALNKAALDTCCTSTVAGEKWMKHYLSSLPNSMEQKVKGPYQGKRCFQFGNQGTLKSTAKYFLPAIIAEKEVMIEVDVIQSDIPMLLSKAEMKKSNMVLYMLEDKVEVLGKSLNLDTTSSGHYLLPLIDESINIQEIFSINLKEANDEDKVAALKKLHNQFGHRPKQSFINLLKAAEEYTPDMANLIDKIIDGCEGCIKRKRNPDKPAVAPPMATEFNEKVQLISKYGRDITSSISLTCGQD